MRVENKKENKATAIWKERYNFTLSLWLHLLPSLPALIWTLLLRVRLQRSLELRRIQTSVWLPWRGERSQRSDSGWSCDCHMIVLLQVGTLDPVADFCRIISRSASDFSHCKGCGCTPEKSYDNSNVCFGHSPLPEPIHCLPCPPLLVRSGLILSMKFLSIPTLLLRNFELIIEDCQ